MRIKRLSALLLSALLVTSPVGYMTAQGGTIDVSSYTQPEQSADSAYIGSYIPSSLDSDAPVYVSDIAVYSQDTVPSAYPEDVSSYKKEHPSRDQNPYGTCWAFSSIGLEEFDLIAKGQRDSSVDLSELQLIHFTFNSVIDPLGGTKGDYSKYYNENTRNSYLDRGGNYEYAVKRLSQWVGAVNESDVPYSDAENVYNNGLDDKYAYQYDTAHLQNAYRINIKEQPDVVKQQIMEHGAVGASYTHYYAGENHNNNSYYDMQGIVSSGGGHAVMIVGWDDDYSKDNFATTTKPSNNGAWLIRNSWGSYFDYFWMSYETYSLADTVWVFDMSADDGLDNNYQLDGGLYTATVGYYTGAANVFYVSEKEGVASETLKSVSLAFTQTADVGYTIDIYTDLKDSSNPISGTKHEEASTSGRTTFAGIHTIPLEEEVVLNPGTYYAVVVNLDKKAFEVEYGYAESTNPGESDDKMVWENVVSYNTDCEGSYYYNGYGGYGKYYFNFCIKAFTSNNVDLGDVLEGYTLSMDGKVDMNFYMNLPDKLVNDSSTYMEFTMPDGNVSKVMLADARKTSDGLYVFSCGIAAKQMADKVSARIVSNGVKGEVHTYSVTDYAESVINAASGVYSDEAVNAVKAMLNYGAAAQQYFNYNTDNLANSIMKDDDKNMDSAAFDTYTGKLVDADSISGISYYGSSLVLESDTALRNYFKLSDGYTIDDYTFYVLDADGNKNTLTPQQSDTALYYVDISNVKANELADNVNIYAAKNGSSTDKTMMLEYGAYVYARYVDKYLDNAALKNLMTAMYHYCNAATEYANK